MASAFLLILAFVRLCSSAVAVDKFELQVGHETIHFEEASPKDLTNLAREYVFANNLTSGAGCSNQACITDVIALRMLGLVAENAAEQGRRYANEWHQRSASRRYKDGGGGSSGGNGPRKPSVRLTDVCPNPTFELALLPYESDLTLLQPTLGLGDKLDGVLSHVLAYGSKAALEIGGPTEWLDMASHLEHCDNVVEDGNDKYFHPDQEAMVTAECAAIERDGGAPRCTEFSFPYIVGDIEGQSGRVLGTTFVRHGANLSGIPDAT